MSIKIISPDKDLIDSIIESIDLQNLKRHLIVFPGNRPRLFLLKRIAERLRCVFEPPLTTSFEDFIRDITQQLYPDISIVDETELIYKLLTLDIKNGLIDKYKRHLSLFLPFAQKVFQDYSILIKGNCFNDIISKRDSILNDLKDLSVRDSVNEYLDIITALEKKLREEKKITLSHTYSLSAEVTDKELKRFLSEYEKVILVDLVPLFKTERTLLEKLKSCNNVEIIYQESEYLNKFELLKGLVDLDLKDKELMLPDLQVYESPDKHAQALMVREILYSIKPDRRFESPDTLIMLPDSSMVRILNEFLLNELGEENFNVSQGIPLLNMPLVKLFNLIFDSIYKINEDDIILKASEFFTLINHEYLQAIKGIKTDRDQIYEQIENKIYEYLDANTIRSLCPNRSALENILRIFIEGLRGIRKVSDLSQYVINIIEFLDKNQGGTLNYGYFNIEAAILMRRFKELLHSVLRDIPISNSEFLSVFNHFVSSLIIRPEGSPLRGIQVLGIFESRAIRFDNVFILDFNDETFFDYRFEDSFLPYIIRNRLKLPTKADYDNYIIYFLDILFSQSKKLYLFYQSGSRFSKHRFLLRHIYEAEKRGRKIEPTPLSYNINLTSEKLIPDVQKSDDIIKMIIKRGISASSLNTYLKCPMKFYLSSILNIDEKEEISDDLDNQTYGDIFHKTFKEYFDNNKKGDIKVEKIKPILKKCFDELIQFRSDRYLINYALLEIILENFIHNYSKYDKLKNSEIRNCEYEIKIENHEVKGKKLSLRGRLDRIDYIKENKTIHIIDYKMATGDNYKIVSAELNKFDGSLEEFKEGRREYLKHNNDIQLPFYIYLASLDKELNKGRSDFEASFLFIRSKEKNFIKTIPYKDDEKDISIDLYKSVVEGLISEILDTRIPFFGIESYDQCSRCNYYSHCYKD